MKVFPAFLWVLFLSYALPCFSNPDLEAHKGGKVSWARLKFPNCREWDVHPQGDLKMINFLRKTTTVNLELNWHVADIDRLEEMCSFPLIFMHAQYWEQLS